MSVGGRGGPVFNSSHVILSTAAQWKDVGTSLHCKHLNSPDVSTTLLAKPNTLKTQYGCALPYAVV